MSKILVTGATGLLGAHVVQALLSQGKNVRATRRSSSPMHVIQNVLNGDAAALSKIEWMDADVTDINAMADAMAGVEYVYHCAAMISFAPWNQKLMHNININGTANLVNLCIELGVKKLCHVSSTAALGRSDGNNVYSEQSQWKTSKENSNYAISKYGGECEVWRGVAEGLNAVIVNPSIILGAGNWDSGSTVIFKNIYSGFPFYTHGVNGWVDARDVAQVMLKLMDSEISGERFVVSSENLTYKEVFGWIAESFHKKAPWFEVTNFIAAIGWRAEYVRTLFTRKTPLITKETATTALHKNYYSTDKLYKQIGYKYIPVKDCVQHACARFLEHQWIFRHN